MFPLLFLIVSFLGRILGEDFILKMIKNFLLENVGLSNVDEIMAVVGTYNLDRGNIFLEIIGIVFVLIASSAFLTSLRNSINEFYNIEKTVHKGRKAIQVNIFERLVSLVFLAVFASVFLIIYMFHSVGFTLIHSWLDSSTDIQVFILRVMDFSFSILFLYVHKRGILLDHFGSDSRWDLLEIHISYGRKAILIVHLHIVQWVHNPLSA
jgi:uncharacterized BrkB/YihY/UPF0761 family membrane protein